MLPRRTAALVATLSLAACSGSSEGSKGGLAGPEPGSADGGIALGSPTRADGGTRSPGGPSGPDVPDGAAPTQANVGAIDTGAVPVGTYVHVTGLALIGPVRSAGPDQSQACTYDVYMQDPNGGGSPAGIRVFVDGLACPEDASACVCAPVGSITTMLDTLTQLGDVYDVVGFVSRYTFTNAPDEHGIYATAVTKTGTAAVPAPIVVSDAGSDFAAGGAGFAADEGMLVSINAGGPSPVTIDGAGLFTFGGARFISGYPITSEDGGVFPPAGSQWTSITGIAWTAYGGGVAPRSAADFVP